MDSQGLSARSRDARCASGKAGLTSSLVSEITSDKDELKCGLIIDSSGCSSQTPSNDAGDVFGETSPEAHDASIKRKYLRINHVVLD